MYVLRLLYPMKKKVTTHLHHPDTNVIKTH